MRVMRFVFEEDIRIMSFLWNKVLTALKDLETFGMQTIDILDLNYRFFESLPEVTFDSIYLPSTPRVMVVEGPNSEGWFKWRPRPYLTKRDAAAYKVLEQHLGIRFPKNYLDWLVSYDFFNIETSLISLTRSKANSNSTFREHWYEEHGDFGVELTNHGYLPIGWEVNDAGPIILDLNVKPLPPVRFVHMIPGSNLKENVSGIVFSSFANLLTCMIHFFEKGERSSVDQLVSDFAKIDPNGAGSEFGQEYWRLIFEQMVS